MHFFGAEMWGGINCTNLSMYECAFVYQKYIKRVQYDTLSCSL